MLFQRVAGTSPLVNCSTAAGQQPKSSCRQGAFLYAGQYLTSVDIRRSQSALTQRLRRAGSPRSSILCGAWSVYLSICLKSQDYGDVGAEAQQGRLTMIDVDSQLEVVRLSHLQSVKSSETVVTWSLRRAPVTSRAKQVVCNAALTEVNYSSPGDMKWKPGPG